MNQDNFIKHPPKSDDGIISAVVAGFVAGVTCVISVLKLLK